MLETIHEYAGEKLAELGDGSDGVAAEMRLRHARFFLAMAEKRLTHEEEAEVATILADFALGA